MAIRQPFVRTAMEIRDHAHGAAPSPPPDISPHSLDPTAAHDRHFPLADNDVSGGPASTHQRDAHGLFPCGAHAFPRVATPAFALGIARENAGFDAWKITLMEPSRGRGHDVIAVIKHEGVSIGVPKKVEGFDRTTRTGVEIFEEAARAIEPNQVDAALGSLLGNPREVRFAVFDAARLIAGFKNQPDDGGVRTMDETDLRHAEGGGTDEICPPPVVLIVRDAIVFPLPESRPAADNEVIRQGQRTKQENNQGDDAGGAEHGRA